MADYSPLFAPGEAFTKQASAAITGGQLLAVSGNGTVAPTSAATSPACGVAARDAANGDKVLVRTGGVHRLVASGAVAAGDFLVPAAAGAVATQVAATADNRVIGIALAGAANGQLVEVQLNR